MARPKDPGERRRRLAELQQKERSKRGVRIGIIVLVVGLAVAGAAYGLAHLPKQPGFVHWHAKYQVYANGDLVSFANPKWDGAIYEAAHLHAPNYDIIHNEAKEGQGTLGKFFEFDLGGKLTSNELVVPTGAMFAGDYVVGGNNTLALYWSNQATGQNWTKFEGNPGDYSFHDGDRLLLLYGSYAAGDIARFEAAFPDFDPSKVT